MIHRNPTCVRDYPHPLQTQRAIILAREGLTHVQNRGDPVTLPGSTNRAARLHRWSVIEAGICGRRLMIILGTKLHIDPDRMAVFELQNPKS